MDKFRFAVGHDDNACSSAWVIWSHKNDVYAGAMTIAGFMKISLHEKGYCQLAIDKRHWLEMPEQGIPQPPKRQIVHWTRRHTPDRGALHVASLIFPTDFLKGPVKKGKPKKPLYLLESAPSGQAVEVGVFFSREEPNTLGQKLARIGLPVCHTHLGNGEYSSVVVRTRPFNAGELGRLPTVVSNVQAVTKEMTLLQPGDERSGLTASLCNDPNEDENRTLRLVEIGGVSLRKNFPVERTDAATDIPTT